ncbi:AraC family transcriptional regulator [Lachnoclostridium sp. Marseille-P6806]|uniref:AraC family transcriptional regulator n=1 Tax=Lachnoclostridium sp. Marseille-P6806 TaxID=2364793 RepID=UPI00102F73A9|nr:AraC family transcriptional regulator [Lachnoclostridium sp. Marseille-P6806]
MNRDLLNRLSRITEEERKILQGKTEVDRTLYYRADSAGASENEIDSSIVLANGRQIDIRPHVRFLHFPKHTHNFIEFVYMCRGATTHIIDGSRIILKEGDLLFLNRHAVQEILPAGRHDIAVNFMIRPSFFDSSLRMIAREESPLRDFIIGCLTDTDRGGNYLYFRVAENLPVQNLMENLIWTMLNDVPNRRTLSQTGMGLLFLYLMNCAGEIRTPEASYEQQLIIRLLSYIETEYREASLSGFAAENRMDLSSLSRLVRAETGSTFRLLLQEKRLSQACFLLRNTMLSVDEISAAVGYENTSFFHRLFRRNYGMSPREYRRFPFTE